MAFQAPIAHSFIVRAANAGVPVGILHISIPRPQDIGRTVYPPRPGEGSSQGSSADMQHLGVTFRIII